MIGAVVFAMAFSAAMAQTSPNLENGFKPYGSYDGGNLDTVNVMNGNLMLHVPMPWNYPQRGGIDLINLFTVSAKTWHEQCDVVNGTAVCHWSNNPSGLDELITLAGTGVGFDFNMDVALHRTWESDTSGGVTSYSDFGYYLTTADGTTHQLWGNPSGPTDPTGQALSLDAIDTTGYHVDLTNVDPTTGVPAGAVVRNRHGIVYQMGQYGSTCSHSTSNGSNGSETIVTCNQAARIASITDGNGNLYTVAGSNGSEDTMGRTFLSFASSAAASASAQSQCIGGNLTVTSATTYSYPGPNGTTNQITACYATLNEATNFGVSGVYEIQNAPDISQPVQTVVLVTLIMPDGAKWTFGYDSYVELTEVGLPLGGSISYTWNTTFTSANCGHQPSRSVVSRTLNDNNGHSYTWNYSWGAPGNTSTTNMVTDPLGNDTVHVFSALDVNKQGYGCTFYETSTQSYQGTGSSRQLLKQVNTTYSSAILADQSGADLGNVVPTNIQTTVYPSGKVSQVTKSYDTGLGNSAPIFGNVVTEKDYDWGQGSPGALLRETDTTYQWQVNSAYLTAHLLDLPSSVITKDGSGNKLAETDYTYDQSAFLTPSGITTQHTAPPNSASGNLTTVSKWLNTSSNYVVRHSNWYDTGELHQAIDALGNTTTHFYDPYYVGAYSTETTNALSQTVSGTYDFNTGLLTSFTDANASYQASGNTQGDPAHSSNYSYDSLSRMTQAQLPPDPNGNRPQTAFQYPDPVTLPFAVTKTRSITPSLSDSATSTYDGLGRVYKTQHELPNGTAEVDTTYDGLNHVLSVTNPYFSTSDPTYGVIQTQYDALGRLTQTTKQDGSVTTAAYDYVPIQAAPGDCTKTTDEAGKQRLDCADGLGRLIEVHEPGDNFNGTQSQGAFSIGGSGLQTYTIPGTNATYASGSVTVNGKDQFFNTTTRTCGQYNSRGQCVDWETTTTTTWDSGTVWITVNGQEYSYTYGTNGGDNVSTISSGLQSTINNSSSYVQVTSVSVNLNASPPTATLYLQARSAGAAGNYSLSAGTTYNQSDFSQASFTTSTSGGSLTGGANGTSPVTVYDQGTVTVSVAGFTASAPYGQSTNSTAAAVASALAGNGATGLSRSGSPVTASASGSTITIYYATVGTAGNVSVSCGSSTSETQYFSGPSFTCPSSTTLTGGYNPEAPSLDFNYFITQYGYDGLSNLLNVTQKGDPTVTNSSQYRVRMFTYDSLSRLLTATNPESGQISYLYDADGNVLQKTSPAPNPNPPQPTQTISYCYDTLNRVTGKAYSAQTCQSGPNGPESVLPAGTAVVSYTYDGGTNGIGHVTSLTDQPGAGSYSYDALGRIASEQRTIAGIQKSLSYTYNLDNSIATMSYPSGAILTYTPDSAGRTLSAVDGRNNINYVTGAAYDAASSLTGFVSGSSSSFSGITNSWQYNTRLQICRITALTTGTSPSSCTDSTHTGNVLDLGYNLNLDNGDNGNAIGITNYKDPTRSQSFAYDALNRLTSAQNAGTNCSATTPAGAPEYWGNSYLYDAWGNLLQKNVTKCNAEHLNLTALANNQLSGYGYDAAGNMTYDATTANTYIFDQENRITGAGGFTYTYDADSNRVEKSNGSTGTIYWSMAPGVVAESDLSGNLKSEYVFLGVRRIARRDFPSNTVSYYFSDHLKTASVITDSSGKITGDEDYYPWGGELTFLNTDSNRYKFTGKERDAETGLDYFGARYYGNWLGRFTSPDPYGGSARIGNPQTLNRYAYVHNNPVAFADYEGLTDYYVFRPLWNSDGPTWAAIKAQAAHGDHVIVYNGREATATNFYRAMETPGARVITAGHTLLAAMQPSGRLTAGSIELRNQDGGDIGVGTLGEYPHPKETSSVPAPDPSQVTAESLAVFGCNSTDLADQYPTVTFTGVDIFIEPDEEGAAAYTSALLGGATFDEAGKAAQQAMGSSVTEDNKSRKNPDQMPTVTTRPGSKFPDTTNSVAPDAGTSTGLTRCRGNECH